MITAPKSKRKIIFEERYSSDMKEVITRPPSSLVRWGILIFCLPIAAMCAFSFFITYPEIAASSVILYTSNPPQKHVSKVNGKLTILKNNHSFVSKGTDLVVIGELDYHRFVELRSLVKTLLRKIESKDFQHNISQTYKPISGLGGLQSDFNLLLSKIYRLKKYANGGALKKREEILSSELSKLNVVDSINFRIVDLYINDLDIARSNFSRAEKLMTQKVIPDLDFNRERSNYINKELATNQARSAQVNGELLLLNKMRESNELASSFEDDKVDLEQQLYLLDSKIQEWFDSHVITSASDGFVSFLKIWQNGQNVESGQEMLQIEMKEGEIFGVMQLRQSAVGRIQQGQSVNVKLASFPYKQFGRIKGTVNYVSNSSASDTTFWANIALENGLLTDQGKLLPFKNGLSGSGEIILSERSLIEFFLDEFRSFSKL